MAVFEIPMTPEPQRFSISLSNVTYQMVVTWNAQRQNWFLSIYDNQSILLVGSLPLVTGNDLLEQYRYLGFSGTLTVQTDSDINAIPTFNNLGIQSHIFFVTTDG